ncbi:sugar transferase [bacterium]|nr:sugar transferase [bacterium]
MTFLIQILSFSISFALAYYLRQELLIGLFKTESTFPFYSLYYLISLSVFICSSYIEGLYNNSPLKNKAKLSSHFKVALTIFFIPALIAFLLSHHTISRGFLLINAALNFVAQISLHYIKKQDPNKKRKVAYIGDIKFFKKLQKYCADNQIPITFLDPALFPLHKSQLLLALEKYEPDEIYFNHFEKRAKNIVSYAHHKSSCKIILKNICFLSILFKKDASLNRSKKYINAFLGEENQFVYYNRLKRIFDLSIILLLLPLWLPLLILIFFLLKVFYKEALFIQPRIGQFGHVIQVYKFKTMHNTKRTNKPKVSTDSRITSIGWFLRRSSLDEVPQIINVILGNMSLIGPRPELINIVSNNYNSLHLRRTLLKPGITGLWQIYGRKQPIHCHLKYDFFYLKNQSLSLDLWILLKTLPAVIFKRGAY